MGEIIKLIMGFLVGGYIIYSLSYYLVILFTFKKNVAKIVGIEAVEIKNGYLKFQYKCLIQYKGYFGKELLIKKQFDDPYRYKNGQLINVFINNKKFNEVLPNEWDGFYDILLLDLFIFIIDIKFIIGEVKSENTSYSTIFIFLGCFVIYVLFKQLINRLKVISTIKKNGNITNGKIIDFGQERDLDNAVINVPVVHFVTEENKSIVLIPRNISSISKKKLGEKIPIVYDKDIPEYAEVYSKVSIYLDVIIITILLFFTFIISTFILVKEWF